jgi:hypothetical protein
MLKKLLYVLTVFFVFWGAAVRTVHAQEDLVILPIKDYYVKTVESMKVLQEAVLDYIYENLTAPEAKTVAELLEYDVGNGLTFAKFFLSDVPEDQIPSKDAWGNDLLYKYKKEKFLIASPGSDGKFEGFDQRGVYRDSYQELEGKDIIISNEGFVYFPIDDRHSRFFRFLLEYLKKFLHLPIEIYSNFS